MLIQFVLWGDERLRFPKTEVETRSGCLAQLFDQSSKRTRGLSISLSSVTNYQMSNCGLLAFPDSPTTFSICDHRPLILLSKRSLSQYFS